MLAGSAAADDWVGGLPLKTVQTGTVTGDLYFSGNPPSTSFAKVVDRTFTLPTAAVAESGRVKWARLYIGSYCGHMQDAKSITYTTKADWNNDGTWDKTWTETDAGQKFIYLQGGDYGGGGNDNSKFTGHSAGEPYLMLNDHTTRVTSDYLSWYDVTNLIQVNQPTIKVNVDGTGSYDGRIKVVELVVAYDDPSSTTQTTYWVNEGHDSCSYYTEDNEDKVAIGSTTFDTSGLSGITSAKLIADYMASNNGYYGFPTAENNLVASTKAGSFTNMGLDRSSPDAQGDYSGIDSWDVTSSVSNNNSVTLAYARYLPATGLAQFYKIPLAFLVVKKPLQSTSGPKAEFSASVTSGTAPLAVKFTDQSTGSPTSWKWDFNNDGTIDSTEQSPSYTYSAAGTYSVNLTVASSGGSDSEVKTNYITVNGSSSLPPVANFTATPILGNAPLTVQFTDASTGNVSSYAWDFNNDGTADSSQKSPSYTYSTAGTYSVKLTVTGQGGNNSVVKTGYITVNTSSSTVATNDLSISGVVNPVPASAVFAKEANTVTIPTIKNTGPSTLTNISVALYASDVAGPVNTTTIASMTSNGTTTATIIDPTIRNLEGSTVTYTAVVDPNNLISETNESNNNKSSAGKSVKYNGYKGKGLYWEGGSNITTKHTYDFQGNLLYSTQPDTAYKSVGWTTRTESWNASDLSVPSGSTIEKVFLYFAYNWDQTPGGYPWLNINFNGYTLDNGNLSTGNGTLYRDWSNFGSYADYEYGLCVYDVTDKFSSSGNSLETNPYNSSFNKVALYPSTLVVIYRNSNETRKQIFINEECDELGLSDASYGTTSEEATAYAPFTGLSINKANLTKAMLYSFAGSAGPEEGNLSFNGKLVAPLAWMGSSNSGSPLVFDATNYITESQNIFGIQSTTSGGMDALQQILVLDYKGGQVSNGTAPVAGFAASVTTGTAPLAVKFTDQSTGSPTSWKWDFNNDGTIDSTEQSPSYNYSTAGTYTVNLTVANSIGSDSEVKTNYITVHGSSSVAPVATFTATPTSGNAPLTVQFTDASTGNVSSYAWDFNNDGTIDSTEKSPSHTYSVAGTYTINLTVTGQNGSDSEVKTGFIVVSGNGISSLDAAFIGTPTSGFAPLTVNFTDQSTGSPTSWIWDFGDGTNATSQNPVHVYSAVGTYTIKLTVGNGSVTDTETKTGYINVKQTSSKLIADFVGSPTSGDAPLNVTFTDISTGSPTSWKWKFGDGSYSSAQNPVHTYRKVGKYSVTLTVKNSSKRSSLTEYRYINVTTSQVAPVAGFSASPTSGRAPLNVQFTDMSTGSPSSWKWNFGDRTYSTKQNPVHKYKKAGKYTVTLTVKNESGKSSKTLNKYVTVSNKRTNRR